MTQEGVEPTSGFLLIAGRQVPVAIVGGRDACVPQVGALLVRAVEQIDDERPGRARAYIEEAESWPAYRLPDGSSVAGALITAARRQHNEVTPARVCGPSNIGNFFSARGIDATCGFG